MLDLVKPIERMIPICFLESNKLALMEALSEKKQRNIMMAMMREKTS